MERKLTFVLEITDHEIKELLCKMSGKLFSDDELDEHLAGKVMLRDALFEEAEKDSFIMMKGLLIGLSMAEKQLEEPSLRN